MKIIKKGLERTAEDRHKITKNVKDIIESVCANGDEALREYSKRFDGFVRYEFRVARNEIDNAYTKITKEEIKDLKYALSNIKAFAEAQRGTLNDLENFSPVSGIFLGHRVIPVQSCCCYVPGGSYPLYSTALMLIAPAKAAGVKRVSACAPVVHGTGKINYKTLVAMDLAGVDEIYAIGGAQAVAAFAYGTESIKPVDMIVGPGNKFVTEAKRQCYGQVGIDFVAGPSEVLCIADGSATPAILAADILAQCEHDPNSKAILISIDEQTAKDTAAVVKKELETLGTSELARQSWDDYGEIIVADSIDEAVALANEYAPEHLEVNVEKPDLILSQLINYGSLFIGENTAEVFGDYASGTNHTLPTARASRYTGGVWVGTFLKVCTHQRMTIEASKKIAPLVERMARGEGLKAHALAAKRRI